MAVDLDELNDVLVLNFRGIPDDVTVTASLMGTGIAHGSDRWDRWLAPLTLVTGDDLAPLTLIDRAWSVCHPLALGEDQVQLRHCQ